MMTAIDRKKYMDLAEVKQLRTVTEGKAMLDLQKGRAGGVVSWMLVDLALTTGLRVSELAALNIEDVDTKRGLSIVRFKRKKRQGETDKQYRKRNGESMAIGKDLLNHLQEFIKWTGRSGGPLFVSTKPSKNSDDGRMTPQGLQRIWKAAIKRAGLPIKLSIHSARHSMAVHLLKKTGNLRQVQKQLGHASPATTANMYADISFEDMQAGVEGLYDG